MVERGASEARVEDRDGAPEAELTWREAMGRVVRSLPAVERVYATVRFSILRPKLLSILDLLLPIEGRILDVGCGFGLFAGYFGQTAPARSIVGIDPNARRIAIAERVARRIGLTRHEFHVGDVRSAAVGGPFDAIYVLDVMHHIPATSQEAVLRKFHDELAPGGRLVMKDVTTLPRSGLVFTRVLDRLMVGMHEELAYRHHREWQRMLERIGFRVRTVRVPDILPYPHVVLSAEKPLSARAQNAPAAPTPPIPR